MALPRSVDRFGVGCGDFVLFLHIVLHGRLQEPWDGSSEGLCIVLLLLEDKSNNKAPCKTETKEHHDLIN